MRGPFNARSGSRVAGSTGGSATQRIRWPTCWRNLGELDDRDATVRVLVDVVLPPPR
ncbi:hypothetical protein MA5S0422_3507 [Mycobacteroides abscessus 5S-0422]|uniref:Uncharacterized protein n=1 Tax=Mycobacteroides abscessus subsp. bolletii 1513 TaxID=1299321 RepID=X8E274_9MYCO|nr:hypothetical protein MA5S0422_3507 [Mycobacteroides abscessus 5S-0422]EIU31088.1 hypothetical protein MA5S1212_5261 [Mycobacteroides abscessus 5S-1212]EIU34142.1 hypothetical protein MA5S0708_0177 [Mycobacteroides abscessus 5S-0708]EUA73940.1 hypothetical protein I540_0283 [Mycobacteroides abscessus subsp. bolletii 1513]